MSDRFSRLFRAPNSAALPPFEGSFEHGSISEQVVCRLIKLVKSGDLKSGDRLPTENQMTLALGISRQALREALKALALMGVLESRQGSRYSVTDLSPSRLVEPFNVMLSGKNFEPEHYHEARMAVDLECVRLCAERAEPERKAEIRRHAEEGHAFVDDPDGFRALDQRFHSAIYAGSGNVFLETVAQGLYTVGLEIRKDTMLLPGLIAGSCLEHDRIAEAIVAGNAKAAVAAYHDHLVHVLDSTMRVLAGAETP